MTREFSQNDQVPTFKEFQEYISSRVSVPTQVPIENNSEIVTCNLLLKCALLWSV
jgi:hypothetical protein